MSVLLMSALLFIDYSNKYDNKVKWIGTEKKRDNIRLSFSRDCVLESLLLFSGGGGGNRAIGARSRGGRDTETSATRRG